MVWIVGVHLVALFVVILKAQNPHIKFSCKGRPSGYYADVESGCQVYHMCDGLGRQFSYSCPNATLFQQRMLICDHWYMVNCSKSEDDYGANLRIGQKEKPFVDDSDSHPYHRTPRPDLLSHPSDTEYNIIYRTGRARKTPNLVGAETEENSTSNTDQPAYFLPSHWSTEYSAQSSTTRPISIPAPKPKSINFNNGNNHFDSPTKNRPKPIPPASVASVIVNYKSNFKATTPVYPRSVDSTSVAPDSLGILPPVASVAPPITVEKEGVDRIIPVNFVSDFKATTPVYPLSVESTSVAPENLGILPPHSEEDSINYVEVPKQSSVVNFQSNFKATTPVYPQTVDATSPEPGDLGVLPPLDINTGILNPNPPAQPNNVQTRTNQNSDEFISPSLLYQPPKVEPDFKRLHEVGEVNKNHLITLNNEQWVDLRKKFFIPDYEFPLDSVSRPSYESSLNSFQVNPLPEKK